MRFFPAHNDSFLADLNGDVEYPLRIHTGVWVTPMDAEHARLFHLRSVADYIRAVMMFPYKSRDYDNAYQSAELTELLETYKRFHGWKMELCNKHKLTDDGTTTVETPLQFYAGDHVLLGKELHMQLSRITSYQKTRSYTHKKAIAQLATMERLVLAKIQDCKKHWSWLQDNEVFTSIDYNAMRAAGYDGFYVHKEALEEAKALPETSQYHYACTVLTAWKGDSVCLWR